jgi:hypothetical protein
MAKRRATKAGRLLIAWWAAIFGPTKKAAKRKPARRKS